MTTPDKEEMPTEDRTPVLPVRLEQPWAGFSCLHIGSFKIGIAVTDEDGTQDPDAAGTALEAWVTACNAYEPMREALAATTIEVERDLADFLSSVCVVRDEGPDRSTLDPEDAEEVARLECIIWRARAALSTLPVNDRQTSDDVGILREALAKIAKIAFEDAADPKTDRLSTVYVIARAALKGPASEAGKLGTDEVAK